MAEVVFEVVNAPFREGMRILILVTVASGIAGASHNSGSRIHTEFESL